MEATKSKYKEGDIVRIIANNNDHNFQIGEVVTIDYIYNEDDSESDFRCSNSEDYWYVLKSDVEPAEPTPENDLAVLDTDLYERMYDQGENPNIAQQPASNEATVNIRIVPKTSGGILMVGNAQHAFSSCDDGNKIFVNEIDREEIKLREQLGYRIGQYTISYEVRIVVNPA